MKLKRFVPVALTLLTLLAPLMAHAGVGSMKRWAPDPNVLTWRTCRASNLGYVDSTVVRCGGLAAHQDTTVAVSTRDWLLPDINATSAADSASWFVFAFTRTGSTAFTYVEDSIYVAVEVSMDGNSWIRAGTAANGPCLRENGLTLVEVAGMTASDMLAPIAELGTTGCFFGEAMVVTGGPLGTRAMSTATTTPGYKDLFGWPLMRFIVMGDYSGEYQGQIYHWTDQ